MKELTEFEKVKLEAIRCRYWYPKRLIDAAIEAKVLVNLNTGKPYSYSRIYAMLKEGKDWVTKKLAKYANEHPITD